MNYRVKYFVLLCFLAVLSEQLNQKVILCFGYTQTGKSSLIKHLTGDESIICGQEGSGESTTNQIDVYKVISPKLSMQLLFIDTIGLGDNSLKFDSKLIRQEIENKILKYSTSEGFNEIHGIFITESLKDSANQLRNILKQISEIFGKLPYESIVVIGTKSNDVKQQDQVEVRQRKIKGIMEDFNIPSKQYVRFITPYQYFEQKDIPQSQYAQLEGCIKRCKPLDSNLIKSKYDKILARAREIQTDTTTIQTIIVQDVYHRQVYNGFFARLFNIKSIQKWKQFRNVSIPKKAEFQWCYDQALKEFEVNIIDQMLVK